MKKIFLACIPFFLLFGCCNSNNQDKKNNVNSIQDKKPIRVKTESGLEYEILKEGTGIVPKKGQEVTVHYTGWLNKDGKEGAKFDSSVDKKMPFVFNVGNQQVIKGWDEGVITMKVGEKRRLFIPASLGYGAREFPRVIPANSNLIFDVELLKID